MPRFKNFIPETVLDKAVSVFAKYGYHGVSMAMLVDELELNRASIYNTFGDKRSLYISSLNQYISNWPIPQANGHDIRIEDLLEFTKKRIYQNNEVRGCYLLKAASELGHLDPEVAAFTKEYYQSLEKAFRKSLEAGKKSFANKNLPGSKEAARFLVAQCYVLHNHAVLSSDRKRPRDIMDFTLSLLN